MSIWQKSRTRPSQPVFWIMVGAIVVLAALMGLCALAPINYEPPQPKFFLSFFLLLAFWIGWVTLTIFLNCWLSLKLSPPEPAALHAFAGHNNPILPWPEQEMFGDEQFA